MHALPVHFFTHHLLSLSFTLNSKTMPSSAIKLLPFTNFWFCSLMVQGSVTLFLLLADAMAQDGTNFWLDFGSIIFFAMVQLVVLVVTGGPMESGYKPGRLIPPEYVKYLNAVGPLIAIVVILLLPLQNPLGYYLHVLFAVAPLYSLSAIMLLRPVVTDAGLFFPSCTILISVTERDYQYGKLTWVAAAYVTGLFVFRCVAEYRAVLLSRQRATRPRLLDV